MSARFVRRSFGAPFVVTLATLPACIVQSSGSASTGPSRPPHAHDHRTADTTPPPATNTPPPATNTPPPATNQPSPNDQVVVANPPRPSVQPTQPQPTGPTRPPVVAPPATTVEPRQQPPVVANPPRPTTQPAQPTSPTRPPVVAPPANQAEAKPPVVVANPPRPTGAGTNPPPANTTPGTVVADTKPAAPTTDRRWTVSRAKGVCKAYIQTTCPTAPKGQPQPTCNPPPPVAYTCTENLADGESMKIVQRAGDTECWIDWGQVSCPKGAICNPPPPRKVACPK